jgi:NTE family protein
MSLFGLPGFYAPRVDFLTFARWTSYYDTSPLLATLERRIDFKTLNNSSVLLTISAVDLESGELQRFCNHGAAPTEITPKHVMASGSMPPQFPWTEIAGRQYWDGGLVNNTPLGDAIAGFGHGEDIHRMLVVMDLYPLHGERPGTMAEVEDRVHELSFGNRLAQDHQFADQINGLIRTIDLLAPLVPAADMTAELRGLVEAAREYKQIEILDIDMQTRMQGGRVDAEDPADDLDGLRDFSAATVKRRRTRGHANAYDSLYLTFAKHGLVTAAQDRRALAPTGS